MTTPDLLKVLLILTSAGMFVLAVFYLCRRRLSKLEYFAFGLLALALPILGPFVVIALRPGRPR
ncbi:MAG: hypothetical protein IT308_07420 [Anaerolineaceae bacterium]|nr:hypothetical protein [Anaerolineaceae bacterium]